MKPSASGKSWVLYNRVGSRDAEAIEFSHALGTRREISRWPSVWKSEFSHHDGHRYTPRRSASPPE